MGTPLRLTGGLRVALDPPTVASGDLFVAEGKVANAAAPGARTLDCDGAVILPGLTCAHTHLYSALARGMPPPPVAPQSFLQILERVWWKLDRALDAETIALSAEVGALEAARAGTTTLIDHHASPSAIDGSLDLVSAAVGRVGLRGVYCYEVSERGGDAEATAGVRENDRFLGQCAAAPSDRVAGLVGAHAPFTVGEATAHALAEVAARHRSGVHIHVAEDAIDADKDGRSTVAWLSQMGLLTDRALLAHCVHVSDGDAARIVLSGAHVVHNPRSNANNAVGYARPSRFSDRLCLGTDGIGADMLKEGLAAFLAARDHGDRLDVLSALERSRRLSARLLGHAPAGLVAGDTADLAVFDYRPTTPIDATNLFGHLFFGLSAQPVRHLIVGGRVVLEHGRAVGVDEEALAARAREAARRLWDRMAA